MSVSFTMDVDLSGINNIEKKLSSANRAFTERVMRDSNKTVDTGGHLPKRTGQLHDSAHMVGDHSIEWSEEYAKYVYYGTSKMDPRPWFEQTKADKEKEWQEYAAKLIGVEK